MKAVISLNKQKVKKTAAIVDIGSNDVQMTLCELKNGELHTLDSLIKPLSLGHEAFNHGTISFDTINALCEILTGFLAVTREYDVDSFAAIATSAMREAKNRNFVLDQIKVKTGISVMICDDSQEKSLIYYEVIRLLTATKPDLFEGKRALITHLGTGSIGLSIYEDDAISFSQNISMGSLKIHDMLDDRNLSKESFYQAAEEYLDVVFRNIVMPYPNETIDTLVMTGSEGELMARLCHVNAENNVYRIHGDSIHALYEAAKKSSMEKLSGKFNISEEGAEMLYSSLSILTRFLKLTKAEEIFIPKAQLTDAFLRQMLHKSWKKSYQSFLEKNALACAKMLAVRYNCHKKHGEAVAEYAGKLFDRLKRTHDFEDTHRIMLQAAAIVHDSGYYVSSDGGCSADIVRNMDLCGLSEQEMKLVAIIGSFNETSEPNFNALHFLPLTPEQLLLCSKLTAIFRLTNALDKSKKQKIRDLKIRQRGDELLFICTCDELLNLEKWSFYRCSPFFKNVFGLQPILQVKSTML